MVKEEVEGSVAPAKGNGGGDGFAVSSLASASISKNIFGKQHYNKGFTIYILLH